MTSEHLCTIAWSSYHLEILLLARYWCNTLDPILHNVKVCANRYCDKHQRLTQSWFRKSLQVMGRSQIPRWIGYLFLSFQSWMLMANVMNGKECLLLLRELFFFHAVLVRSLEVCFSTNPDRDQYSCRRYHEHISICGTCWYEDLCSCLRLVQFCSILK